MTLVPIRILTTLAVCLSALAAAPATAQDFPKGPVRLIVPFTAGGATDVIARLMSQKLNDIWSQPVLVDYRPGAGTLVGVDAAAKSAPDGHTIGIVVSSFTINPALRLKMPYDTLKDLSGVTLLTRFAIGLVAHPDVPFNDIKGLVDYAKRNPGKLSFASPGTGGTAHLTGELLKAVAGIDMVHVPYKGGAPGLLDVMAGRVQLMCEPLFSAMTYVRPGKLKVIAVSSERRSPGYEQFPAVAETYPGFDVSAYLGFVVPSATPRAIVRKIRDDSVKALNSPDVRPRIVELGNELVGSTPEEFEAFIASDMKKWTKVIHDAGIPRE
jgi:tripartite-type tricarboxylate transporter receptor subunit TctC